MTDNYNDDDADDSDFDDTLGEILGASFMAPPSLDLDLAFGAVDTSVNLDRTHLVSPLSLASPPLPSPSFSATAGEPIRLRSRSFHCYNHLFPLLVAVL